MDMKIYEGKQVYVKLISQRFYQGKIIQVTWLGKDNFDVDIYMLDMIDKFGSNLSFTNKEINLIEVEK